MFFGSSKYDKVGEVYRRRKSDDSWVLWVLGGIVLIAILASA